MTCKDCAHCNVCKAYDDDTKYCNQFQNKSDLDAILSLIHKTEKGGAE